MAFVVYYFNRNVWANRLFALFLINIYCWALSGAMYIYFPVVKHVWVAIQMAFGILIGPLFWFFVRSLVKPDYRPRKVEYLVCVPAVYVIVISGLRIFHPYFSEQFSGHISVIDFQLHRKSDISYIIYTVGIFGEALASLVYLGFGIYRQKDTIAKNRLTSIFFAFIFLTVLFFIFNALANILGFSLNPNFSIAGLSLCTIWIVRSLLRDKAWKIEQLLALVSESRTAIELEKEKSDKLLMRILPQTVALELKETGKVKPVHFDSVSVLFTDFKDFSTFSSTVTPQELVSELDYYFTMFDEIMMKHGLEKLKTIGDSYMCAGGIPVTNTTHPVDIILAAIDICAFMDNCAQTLASTGNEPWGLRIGIHTGPLVAGVIGNTKMVYDTWGDTVNIASRMESSSEPGKINVSLSTKLLAEPYFDFISRGAIEVKNKGLMEMFYVKGIKSGQSRK